MNSDLWSLLSPFIAAGTAVFLAKRQDRERVSCFVEWAYDWDGDGRPIEYLYVGIHNRSPHPVGIVSVRFLRGGVLRSAEDGTALSYEDPIDLRFPYIVEPGAIKTLALDEDAAQKLARSGGRFTTAMNNLLRRPRLMVECATTGGTRLRASGEKALPWTERQKPAKH